MSKSIYRHNMYVSGRLTIIVVFLKSFVLVIECGYRIAAGKLGEFGKWSVICQTKNIQISAYN